MNHTRCAVLGLLLNGMAATVAAQEALVVPAAFTDVDAGAYGWVAGASRPVRQQTLIGSSHLVPMVNRVLTSISLRRQAIAETYLGGIADMTVTLSIAPHAPIGCSSAFADNVGNAPVQVYSGPVTIPFSPAPTGPNVPWTADNVIRIEFTTPFLYSGGTLCVDVVGTPLGAQAANWWMADLQVEDIGGAVNDLGGGCGLYGGQSKSWATVSRRSLLPGAHARFSAYGTPGGSAIVLIGSRGPAVPLAALGLPALPSCSLHLQSIHVLLADWFAPPADVADLPFGGEAELQIKVPSTPAALGFVMTTQWIDWTQVATSNAIEWTIGSVIPSLDMAQIDGHATDARGIASPTLAHVFRFEYL